MTCKLTENEKKAEFLKHTLREKGLEYLATPANITTINKIFNQYYKYQKYFDDVVEKQLILRNLKS